MSVALANQYGCWSGLKYANDTALVVGTMLFRDSHRLVLARSQHDRSYDLFENDIASWRPPQTQWLLGDVWVGRNRVRLVAW
ncbi:pectinesterase/pectinesterase inhibitor 51 [Spatholobus suberectus]|nr:pectinesterase/pectinesterase inhibitor 51 [Spatholobus suberectus]